MFGNDLFYLEEEVAEIKTSTRKLLQRLLPYFYKFRTRIITATILLLVSTGLGLLGPVLLKHAIDVDIKQGSISGLVRTSIIYLVLQIVVYLIGYFQRVSLAIVGERACALLKENLYRHIINLPLSFFDKNPVGKLLTRVDSDTEAIKNLFTTSAVVLTQDLVLLIGMSVVMSIINYKLFLVILILLPPFIYAFWWFQKNIRPVYLKVRRKVAEINNFVNETLQALPVVQAFNREEHSYQKMENLSKDKFQQELVGMKLWYRIWFLVDFGEVLGLVLILGIGGIWALKGLITIGTLFLFANYITRLFMPLRGLSDQLNIIQRALASAERIFGIFSERTEESPKIEIRQSLRSFRMTTSQEPKICFQHVYFKYETTEKTEQIREWILEDINFSVKNGEKIALVGETGGGKTSIISLLLKFYLPQKGNILIDNKDIMAIDYQTVRSKIGFVPQDIILFPGSVLDNLRLFDKQISLEQVKSAVDRIKILPTIENFPNGFETDLVARGINLSLGERQLLSFARALVREPEILILDEATSSVDPHTERLLQEGLETLLKGRTAIIIAHRLATIQMVDRIFVIHQGKIVEQGTHLELLKKHGYYYRLYRLQYLEKRTISEQKPTSFSIK
ncbi:MAG: ABC transporter ATP-binding protein/permease [candidate division WOR-3 bacterium]|nr:ABC transporter ATP-binding protein/permease [candidate division WOR-3 bacterium]